MGRCITEGLRASGYDVISTSRTPNEELGISRLDIRDAKACVEAFRGVDTVIHMAFYLRNDKFHEEIVPTNIVGTYNVFEAARANGVKRVIFGSSNHVVGFYKRTDELRDDIMQRPDSPYGLSKGFCELCGRYYSDRYGISVINVRIGSFTFDGLPTSLRTSKLWLSRDDTQQLFQKCVEADPAHKFLTIYGVSGNDGCYFDIAGLKDLIGYVPRDNGADHLAHALEKNMYGGADDCAFIGGAYVTFDSGTGKYPTEVMETLLRAHGANENEEGS
jgi:uronate dehydrogenase